MHATPPRPRAISPKPTASARTCWPRASSSRTRRKARNGSRPDVASRTVTPDYWEEACRHLSKRDRVMRKLIPQCGEGQLQSRGDAFTTLARSIVGQQISVKAAQAVWDRFAALVEGAPGRIAASAVLESEVADMRAAGLSARKVEYL